MTMPALLKNLMGRNIGKLLENEVALHGAGSTTTTVVNGVPVESQTYTESWSGMGSIQYVRPRIQKSFADPTGGVMEDTVAAVAYLPYEAMPTADQRVEDVDGVLGPAGSMYTQSREPANVGGLSLYWECYIGKQVGQ